MTKGEKLAISIAAILGFAAFCIALIPLGLTIGFIYGDSSHFMRIEHNELPRVVGEDYVFVSQNFFDENAQLIEYDGLAEVLYMGKGDRISRIVFYDIYFEVIGDDCSNANAFIHIEPTSYEYNNNFAERYELGNYRAEFFAIKICDNGNMCRVEVVFNIELNGEDYLQQHDKYYLQYKALFESLLDNLVGYSHFIANT